MSNNNNSGGFVQRHSVSSKESRLLREAVRRANNPALPSKFSGAASAAFVAIEGSATTAVIDGDEILDGHVALWDEDDWDALDAFWA